MNTVVHYGKRMLRHLSTMFITRIPPTMLRKALAQVATIRASMLPPAEGLRLLLGLEADLYPAQGGLATAYGGGIHTKHRHMRYHDFFVERVQSGERVLDIGCGIGAVAQAVAERSSALVVGIDLSKKNIMRARQLHAHKRVQYIVGDALQTLPSGYFNVVILSNVLEHLPNRANFLRRVQASVHPSRLLIRVPLFERDWRVPLKKELGIEWRLDPTHETEYTLESFDMEMKEANLQRTHLEVRWGEIWSELVPETR